MSDPMPSAEQIIDEAVVEWAIQIVGLDSISYGAGAVAEKALTAAGKIIVDKATLDEIYAELRGAVGAPDLKASQGRAREALRVVCEILNWGDYRTQPKDTGS